MKILTQMTLVLALAASMFAQQPAKDTADQPAKDQPQKKEVLAGRDGMTENFFKLAFVMYELDDGKRTNLMFGPEPGKGGSFVVPRNPPATPRPAAQAFVDHICYTIPNWDDARVDAALKATGRPFSSRPGNKNVLDPFNYPVQLANIEEENPWK